MSIDVERFAKNVIIDGDMSKLLKRSRQGEKFNLYEEMEKLGYTEKEIIDAARREMERQAKEFRIMTNRLISCAIVERLFHPDDFG